LYKKSPTTLFIFTKKEQLKTHILLDRWKSTYPEVQETIRNTKKACARMWSIVDELMELFHMPFNEELNMVGPSEATVVEVVKISEKTKHEIKQLDKVDREIINQYITHPMKCVSGTKEFMKGTQNDFKVEVVDRVYDGKLELEEIKLDSLNIVTQSYESWINFVNNLALERA
jgi:hypothetical protein